MRVTFYADVLSMWCSLGDEVLERLQREYAGRVEFVWKVALIEDGRPIGNTPAMEQWYYDRCEFVTGRRFDPRWLDDATQNSRAANAAVEAARLLGATDDTVRRAMARAACAEGRKVAREDEAVRVVAGASGFPEAAIREAMGDPRVDAALAESLAEFAALGADQRPTFHLTNAIGDRALLVGIYRYEPVHAALAAMLADEEAYARFAATHPPIPASSQVSYTTD
jgi:predicted DsbA family dithiol-disulfide isomerase